MKKAYHHGDLRQALVDGAVQLIGRQKSPESLSLRELARHIGISYGAPYHHFEDKNALLAAVGAEGFRTLNAEMDARLEAQAGGSAEQRFHALGLAYVTFAASHPAHYRVMFGWKRANPSDYPELHAVAQAAFDRLVSGVEQVQAERGNREPALMLALAIWSGVHGLASLWNDGPLRHQLPADKPEHYISALVELFGRIITPSTKGVGVDLPPSEL